MSTFFEAGTAPSARIVARMALPESLEMLSSVKSAIQVGVANTFGASDSVDAFAPLGDWSLDDLCMLAGATGMECGAGLGMECGAGLGGLRMGVGFRHGPAGIPTGL